MIHEEKERERWPNVKLIGVFHDDPNAPKYEPTTNNL